MLYVAQRRFSHSLCLGVPQSTDEYSQRHVGQKERVGSFSLSLSPTLSLSFSRSLVNWDNVDIYVTRRAARCGTDSLYRWCVQVRKDSSRARGRTRGDTRLSQQGDDRYSRLERESPIVIVASRTPESSRL